MYIYIYIYIYKIRHLLSGVIFRFLPNLRRLRPEDLKIETFKP